MAEEEFITMANNSIQLDDSVPLKVRRGRVESVDLYEIKDTELATLEKGTPADLQLNFAVFLISLAFSAIATLTTATFSNKAVETIFIVVSVVGILLGVYLMIAWWRTRSEVKELCRRIKQRIPPDVLVVMEEATEPELAANGDAEPLPHG